MHPPSFAPNSAPHGDRAMLYASPSLEALGHIADDHDRDDSHRTRRLPRITKAGPGGNAMKIRHLNPDGTPKYTNSLISQTSPYLRQHAHNPVDWMPWGEEALQQARREQKPIHLSIGY